jgi:hypothetical protein
MKLSKTQIRRLIAEERARLAEQGGETLISEKPSELEEAMAMAMQEQFELQVGSQQYQGTGSTWAGEVSTAGFDYYQAIIDSGALKMVLELFEDVEERLHDGDYA